MRDISRRGLLGVGTRGRGRDRDRGLRLVRSGRSADSAGPGKDGGAGRQAGPVQSRAAGPSVTAPPSDTGKQPQPAAEARAARAGPDAAAVRGLLLGRRGRGRQRPLPALPRTRQGPRRGDDLLPLRALSAARVEEDALPPAEQPASAPPTSAISPTSTSRTTLKYVRQAWLDGPRDRHPLQRPLLRRLRLGRQLDARAVAERDRPGHVVRHRVADEHRLDGPRPAALRLPQGTRRRPHALSARPGQPAAHRAASSAGATTPARPAAARCGPTKRRASGTCRCSRCRSPGTPSRCSRWTTTSSPTSRRIRPRACPRNYPGWRKQATDAYIAGFQRAYETNRAPFFIGNHFEQWNGGIYMDAVEEALKDIAGQEGRTARLLPAVRATGSTSRTRRCSPSSVRSRSGSARPAAGTPFLQTGHRLTQGLRLIGHPAGGCAKIPGTAMRNFSHEPWPRPPTPPC